MNPLVFPILRLLSDNRVHSVPSVSDQFKCSYADVYKVLDEIGALGIELISTFNHYYRWEKTVQWLDSKLILKELGVLHDFYDVNILDITDSTNNFLLNQYKKEFFDNQTIPKKTPVVVAELQTGGRGRLNRRWYSSLGDSLTFSVGWWFNRDISALTGLSLVIGIAILRALKSAAIYNVHLKWPNDVVSVANYRKLAGVLVDFKRNADRLSFAVIGIGINFKLSSEVISYIQHPATDLFSLAGRMLDRNSFLSILLTELHCILINFEKYGFKSFQEEWINSHAFEGKTIYLMLPDCSAIEGIVNGVNEDGSLCLLTEEGKKSFHVGEVSIRIKNDDV